MPHSGVRRGDPTRPLHAARRPLVKAAEHLRAIPAARVPGTLGNPCNAQQVSLQQVRIHT